MCFLLVFVAGFLCFVSPCVLPVFPAFISYITGMSYNEVENQKFNARAIFHTIFFLVGFSLFYIALGFGTAFLGGILIDHANLISQLVSILIIIFRVIIISVFNIYFLMIDIIIQFNIIP